MMMEPNCNFQLHQTQGLIRVVQGVRCPGTRKAGSMTINTAMILYFPGPFFFLPGGCWNKNTPKVYVKGFHNEYSLKGLAIVKTTIVQARYDNVLAECGIWTQRSRVQTLILSLKLWVHEQLPHNFTHGMYSGQTEAFRKHLEHLIVAVILILCF